MSRIRIEENSKKRAAMILAVALMVLGIFIIVPLVTNFSVSLIAAFALAGILSIVIAIAYVIEDIIDDIIGTKNFGELGETITVIILSVLVLSVVLDWFMVVPMSVKLLLLAITIIVEKVSKPVAKFAKL